MQQPIDTGLVTILAELYARVFEKAVLHSCPANGHSPEQRLAGAKGLALARSEAKHAVDMVVARATPPMLFEVKGDGDAD